MANFDPQTADETDEIAKEEAAKLADGDDLERDGKRREHDRHQKFRDHANRAFLGIFWIVIVCLGIGVLAFTIQLVTPWHPMSKGSFTELGTILGSAVTSGMMAGYVRQRLS